MTVLEFKPRKPARPNGAFWSSPSEQLTYEHAVEANPRGENEGAISYIKRIAALAQARLQP